MKKRKKNRQPSRKLTLQTGRQTDSKTPLRFNSPFSLYYPPIHLPTNNHNIPRLSPLLPLPRLPFPCSSAPFLAIPPSTAHFSPNLQSDLTITTDTIILSVSPLFYFLIPFLPFSIVFLLLFGHIRLRFSTGLSFSLHSPSLHLFLILTLSHFTPLPSLLHQLTLPPFTPYTSLLQPMPGVR